MSPYHFQIKFYKIFIFLLQHSKIIITLGIHILHHLEYGIISPRPLKGEEELTLSL